MAEGGGHRGKGGELKDERNDVPGVFWCDGAADKSKSPREGCSFMRQAINVITIEEQVEEVRPVKDV